MYSSSSLVFEKPISPTSRPEPLECPRTTYSSRLGSSDETLRYS